jgi:hypothetical protein
MASAIVASPIGRLMKKIQCQLSASVSTPPSTWPMEAPAAPVKLNTPIALARSLASVNNVTRMPSTTAEAMALPTPWTNLAKISIPGPVANPASRDAAVKTAFPARNMTLRPMRSPNRPARSSSPPKAIRYALTVQLSPAGENPRSRWMAGIATVTMLPSRIVMSIAADSTASASPRDPVRGGEGAVYDMAVSCSKRNRRDRSR